MRDSAGESPRGLPSLPLPEPRVDEDDPPADYANTEGVMWRVGELFVDAAAEIVVEVEAQTATGFQVGILVGTSLFGDGFEAGNTSTWSDTVP